MSTEHVAPDKSTSASAGDMIAWIEHLLSDHSDRQALITPTTLRPESAGDFQTLRYGDLRDRIQSTVREMRSHGIAKGMRVVLLIPPGPEYIVVSFALMHIAAIPVLIDPGMGISALCRCIREARPEAMIAIARAHVLRLLYPASFRSLHTALHIGLPWIPGSRRLRTDSQLDATKKTLNDGSISTAESRSQRDTFMIGYTSGSTGPAKGVVVDYQTAAAQFQCIRTMLKITEDAISLPAFAPFALRDIAMGMSCVLPAMDHAKPASVNPQTVLRTIELFGVTHSFGSPAFWSPIAHYCKQNSKRITSLRMLSLAGAPVQPSLLRDLYACLPEDVEIHTPYGATEALPITTIEGREILNETAERTLSGNGVCVGQALPGVEIIIMEIHDEAVSELGKKHVLPVGCIGEIVVRGEVVSREYFERPDDTARSKIYDGETVWHRMGDVGYLDEHGRLWFCGRVAHRVRTNSETLFTIPCEAIFNQHPEVRRSALVGIGKPDHQLPVVVVECHDPRSARSKKQRDAMRLELLHLGSQHEHTRNISDVLFHSGFPVDARHNAKIKREILARWAERQLA